MKKAELKTKLTAVTTRAFLETLSSEQQKKDSAVLVRLMKAATGAKPKMWGTSIIGFGSRHMKYPSGREFDWMKIAFSPRKTSLVLYLTCGHPLPKKLLAKLGKHRMGAGCLYIRKLDDVNMEVLKELIAESLRMAESENAAAGCGRQ